MDSNLQALLGKAYLDRHPAVAKSPYADDPFAHYQEYGQGYGWTWDDPAVAAKAQAATPDPAAEAAQQIPAYAAPGDIYGNSDEAWGNYMTAGRASTEGMQRSPFTFNNYAAIPEDPTAANAMFYQDPQEAVKANPLLSGMAGLLGGQTANAAQAPQGDEINLYNMHPGDPAYQAEHARRLKEAALQQRWAGQ